MKFGLKLFVVLLFILVVIPVGIYPTILEDNNITQVNTTLLNVPDVTMPNNYSSGPAALQAVLTYYGTNSYADQLINTTNTTENGTLPSNIAQTASNLGFTADVKENMSLKDLQGNLSQGKPVIVVITNGSTNSTSQNMTQPQTEYIYLVVIGMDDQNVYFEDPALIGSRGFLPIQEFLDKWFIFQSNQTNTTVNSNETNTTGNNTTVVVNNTLVSHLGIIIGGNEPVTPSPFIKVL